MATAQSAYTSAQATPLAGVPESSRHSAIVRVTHWINALSFFGLVVSGFAILIAHPRFYWGETGGLGTPYVFELPLPYMKGGPSGWGRNLHFLVAWICVANGLVYALSGLVTRHFRRRLVTPNENYDVLQRMAYLSVIFGLLPFLTWTGFAMSPALTSLAPAFVTSLGGQQSARTLHFFAAIAIVVFFVGHLAMVYASGFRKQFLAMIFGKERA
ncbi:MAG: hypothetical protein EXQ47_01945 [Bryobacterales bacterium]|nr:hypothetical protein [Bryobacterales bacterium]